MKNPLYRIPAGFRGERIRRQEPCRLCGSTAGIRVGKVDYWDLCSPDIIRCDECRHMQLDPMLTDAETAAGCRAYYFEELQRVGEKETEKNAERNFRRGVLFGYKLKRRGLLPAQALEMGPGSGYFAAGIKFVFPKLEMTVMDVNAEVLALIREKQGFYTIEGVPEKFTGSCENRFDLVITRDLLEHVADVPAALRNIVRYLVPGGVFHFITPNGQEDVWKHYLAARMEGRPSELLINHVNYFDGKSLRDLLETNGLSAVEYHTYGIKRTLRGNGWKYSPKLMAGTAKGMTVAEFVQRTGGQTDGRTDNFPESPLLSEIKDRLFDYSIIQNDASRPVPLKRWYISSRYPRMTWLYCLWHHFVIFRLPPEANVGHEIWGIFRKLYP